MMSQRNRWAFALWLWMGVTAAQASSLTPRLGLCVPTRGDPVGWGANCINPSLTLLDNAILTNVAGTWTAPQTCGAGCTIQGQSGGQVVATRMEVNPTNCEPGFYPTGIDEFGAVEGCSALLASLTIPTGATPIVSNATGFAKLYQVPPGAKNAHAMAAWVSVYNYDTNANNNVPPNQACNGKTWAIGVKDSEIATSTLAVPLTDTTTCPTVADATAFVPSSALSGTNSILLDSEWIIFAGKSGNQLTPCTRGAHQTTATTHTAGIVAKEYQEKRLVDIWAAALTNACTDADCTAAEVPCVCCAGANNSACVGAASSVPSAMAVPLLDVPMVPGGAVVCTLAGSSAAKCHVACGFNGYLDP
jgi:hypothetical protein